MDYNEKKKVKRILNMNFKVIIFLSLLLLCSRLFAQDIPNVNITLKLKITDGDFKNCQIIIIKAGAPYIVIEPNKEGNAIDLPLGFDYTITFIKKGYNTKRILVDSHVPENREKGDFERQFAEVSLEKISGILEDNYVQLIGKMAYSFSKADFKWEKDPSQKEDKAPKNVVAAAKVKPVTPKPVAPKPVNTIPPSDNKPEAVSFLPRGRNKDVKVISEDFKIVTIVTITIDGKEIIYKKEEYSFATFFYKDGKRIIEDTYINETL